MRTRSFGGRRPGAANISVVGLVLTVGSTSWRILGHTQNAGRHRGVFVLRSERSGRLHTAVIDEVVKGLEDGVIIATTDCLLTSNYIDSVRQAEALVDQENQRLDAAQVINPQIDQAMAVAV